MAHKTICQLSVSSILSDNEQVLLWNKAKIQPIFQNNKVESGSNMILLSKTYLVTLIKEITMLHH